MIRRIIQQGHANANPPPAANNRNGPPREVFRRYSLPKPDFGKKLPMPYRIPGQILRKVPYVGVALMIADAIGKADSPEFLNGWVLRSICGNGTTGGFSIHKWRSQPSLGTLATSCLGGQAISGEYIDPSHGSLVKWGRNPSSIIRWANISQWNAEKIPNSGLAPVQRVVGALRVPISSVQLAPEHIPYRAIPHKIPNPLSAGGNALPPPPGGTDKLEWYRRLRSPRRQDEHNPAPQVTVGPAPTARPVHAPRPPRPREREGKAKSSPGVLRVLGLINTASEAADMADWMFEGLPKALRDRLERENGKRPLTPIEKAHAVWKHMKDGYDWEAALKAAVANMLEDKFWGTLGKYTAKANQELFAGDLMRGIETGGADEVIGDMLRERERMWKYEAQKLKNMHKKYKEEHRRDIARRKELGQPGPFPAPQPFKLWRETEKPGFWQDYVNREKPMSDKPLPLDFEKQVDAFVNGTKSIVRTFG
jgi:hypothetical protein